MLERKRLELLLVILLRLLVLMSRVADDLWLRLDHLLLLNLLNHRGRCSTLRQRHFRWRSERE